MLKMLKTRNWEILKNVKKVNTDVMYTGNCDAVSLWVAILL